MSCMVLVRHGQSIWNLQNRFTGWVDVSLSRQGIREAEKAGELLADFRFDVAFTSNLMRAQDNLFEILKRNNHCDQYLRVHEQNCARYEHFKESSSEAAELRIYVSESLNERFYGDLQGLNKNTVSKKYGADQILRWRRSYDEPPPGGESLKSTAHRVLPYYRSHIEPHLQAGKTAIVSAHGNSLRALIMHLEELSPKAIASREVATGTPLIYAFTQSMEIASHTQLGGSH